MPEPAKQLTLFEASSIVAGLGVGGGILAVPYLAASLGLGQIIGIMVLAYGFSLLLHLMVAEMVTRDGGRLQLVELFGKYLFSGRSGVVYTWVFFALIALTFFALLAGYLTGCADILLHLLGLPRWAGELVTYVVAAGVVFFGLKAVGISEKYAVVGIAVVLLILCAGSFGSPWRSLPLWAGWEKKTLAFYGMLMFGFACFFSVPQAAEGLTWNTRLLPWAITLGIGLNFIFTLVIALMAILVSKEITVEATLGWGEAVGQWALVLGAVFTFLAMLTSYWGVSYALAVIVKDRLRWGDRRAWLFASLPSLLLAVSNLTGFLGFMRIAGGAVAVMVAIQVVPALRKVRRVPAAAGPYFDLGVWGGPFFQVMVIAAYLVMAVGSVVPVK
jgi:amino acid permease